MSTKNLGKVIAVISPKAGLGSTSVSVLLGSHLAKFGSEKDLYDPNGNYSVCIVEFNNDSHLGYILGDSSNNAEGLLSSLSNTHKGAYNDLIDKNMVKNSMLGVSALLNPGVSNLLFTKALPTLREMFDFVILDIGVKFRNHKSLLDSFDQIILVSHLDFINIIETKEYVDKNFDKVRNKIGIVFNDSDNPKKAHENYIKSLGMTVLGSIPSDQEKFETVIQHINFDSLRVDTNSDIYKSYTRIYHAVTGC